MYFLSTTDSLQNLAIVNDNKLHGYKVNGFETLFCYGKNELLVFLSRVCFCTLSYATDVFLHYIPPSELCSFLLSFYY